MRAEEWIANLAAERDRRADKYPALVAALKEITLGGLWQANVARAALKEAGEIE
jgi:hypothetical protein